MTAADIAAHSAPLSSAAAPPRPIRWRQALLTGVAVYPAITLYLYLLFPLTDGWALWQRTALLVPLMVATIVWVIAPLLQRYFGWFIMGRKRK
ncbi:MAG TPA: hypothetical protein VIN06_09795 [Devosia sp.]